MLRAVMSEAQALRQQHTTDGVAQLAAARFADIPSDRVSPQVGPSGPPAPIDSVVALARGTLDSPDAARRKTRTAASDSKTNSGIGDRPCGRAAHGRSGSSGYRECRAYGA